MKSSEQLQRAQKWLQDGVAARRDGDARRTRELLGKAFAVFERLSHPRGIVLATHHLGLAEYQFGRFDEAIAWLQRSIETARAVGARREEALSLGNLGLLFNDRGDLVGTPWGQDRAGAGRADDGRSEDLPGLVEPGASGQLDRHRGLRGLRRRTGDTTSLPP